MTLNELLPELKKDKKNSILGAEEILHLTNDSRNILPQSLFLAVKGQVVDGRHFISQAIEKGAVAVLKETDKEHEHLTFETIQQTPVISFFQLGKKLSELAGTFYQNPSEKLRLVGVTGTNGKTTISQLLAQWVKLLGGKSAVMGTIGNGLLGEVKEAKNTTGSPLSIQQSLADFVEKGADFCAMEVSSHGLDQDRVAGLTFDATIFTNLSRDHLDYHQTMNAYALAKKRLFSDFPCQNKIINADDDIGLSWLNDFPEAIAVSCQAQFETAHQFVKAKNIQFHAKGATIDIQSSWGEGQIHSPLIGAFNVSNLLCVFATMLSLGYNFEQLCETVPKLEGICGRMQTLTQLGLPTAVVDYAHTPDALEKALQAARIHCEGKLWCIFGCGGDRDRGKRPLMAQSATTFADFVIVTDDNPRTEDRNQIFADIRQGLSIDQSKWTQISDRKEAIHYALTHALPQDLILIAGKGHEDYQIIGTTYHHFSDQEVVLAFHQ